MIDAEEALGIALAIRADKRAAMAAGVEMDIHLALLVAHENNRAASHFAGDEIAGLFQLRPMTDINPAFGEDLAIFIPQNILGHVHFAIEKEDALLLILDDV